MNFSSIILFFVSITAAYAYPSSYGYRHGYHHKPVVHYYKCLDTNPLRYNPPGLFDKSQVFYSQISIDHISKIAHISGQVALTPEKTIPLKTVPEQLYQAEKNLKLALSSISAHPTAVSKVTVYIVDYDHYRDLSLVQKMGKTFGEPAVTLVGINQLGLPDLKVAIEATVSLSQSFIDGLKNRKCKGNTLLV